MLFTLFTILLLEGFITISVEILTIRQLMPFYGNSVVITSIIIGFFLLFLALGYWRGGMWRNQYFERLGRNYLLSMIWIGVGLSYSFIKLFSYSTMTSLSLSYLMSLTLYLILVLAPIVYWLGQTIPITTNLFNQNQSVSKISGSALFLSTVGSFLGAMVTSLLLFQYVGVAWTVVINCILLFALVLKLKAHGQFGWWTFLLFGVVMLLIKNLNVDAESQQFKLTNNYGNYEIIADDKQARILKINESASSMITPDQKGFGYIEFIRNILFEKLALKNKQILIIGAGGFSLTANGTHDNQVTYVDIDPAIKSIAEQYFLSGPIKGNFVGEDIRLFLNQRPEKYDVIISDAYSNDVSIPPSLLTVEYFELLANHLKPSGLIVLNIISNPLFKDDYSRRLNNTIFTVFPYCSIIPLNWDLHLSNVIYICPNNTREKGRYTDNLNSSTFDYFTSRQRANEQASP